MTGDAAAILSSLVSATNVNVVDVSSFKGRIFNHFLDNRAHHVVRTDLCKGAGIAPEGCPDTIVNVCVQHALFPLFILFYASGVDSGMRNSARRRNHGVGR